MGGEQAAEPEEADDVHGPRYDAEYARQQLSATRAVDRRSDGARSGTLTRRVTRDQGHVRSLLLSRVMLRSNGSTAARCIDYSLKITTVALPFSGMDPPLEPEATATYCLPL